MKCIVCNSETDNNRFCSKKCYDSNRYIEKKIHIKEVQIKYYLKNKEQIDAKNRLWFENNRERDRKRARIYYKNNREACLKCSAKCRDNIKGTPMYKDYIKRNNMKRRAIKENIVELFTLNEWKEKLQKTNGICPICNYMVGMENLTIDHIYPVSKAEPGQVYTINDVQPLCKSCNSKKGVKIE